MVSSTAGAPAFLGPSRVEFARVLMLYFSTAPLQEDVR